MKIIAVNGRAFTPALLRQAVRDARGSGPAIQLIVENTGYFKVLTLDYHGGERYPVLKRVSETPDRLDEILAGLPAECAALTEVGFAVNDARYDGPDCLAPPLPDAQVSLF